MGTAILIIVGMVTMITLIFAGLKWVMPESFSFKACAFKWFTIDMEMKLPPQNSAGEVEAPIPPVDTATMTPCELPATPVSPATDKDSRPTHKSNLRNAAYTLKTKAGRSRSRHSDDDLSASRYTSKPRPGYDALLADINSGRVEVIVITEMTRLYRRLEELPELIKLAETTALRRIETTKGMSYDLSTGEGVHQEQNTV